MPIEYTSVTKKYNKTICDDLGVTVPRVRLRRPNPEGWSILGDINTLKSAEKGNFCSSPLSVSKKCIVRRFYFGTACKTCQFARCAARCLCAGPHLGHHGHWRVSDLPHP